MFSTESFHSLDAKTHNGSVPVFAQHILNLLKHVVSMRRMMLVLFLAMTAYYVYMLTHHRSHLADFRVYY
ncbi:MAG: hypothetical protein ACKO6L_10315, partial [Flavobacteriales bacterium]